MKEQKERGREKVHFNKRVIRNLLKFAIYKLSININSLDIVLKETFSSEV